MMELLIKGGKLYRDGALQIADILIEKDKIIEVGKNLKSANARIFDAGGMLVSPGFTDLHTHLREPGFEEKETIATGTASAAAGGFTTVCSMPNLNPVPHDLQALEAETDAIERDAVIRVLPYGAITRSQTGHCIADIEILAPMVEGFSDDGRGVQQQELMERAMRRVAAVDGLVVAHCEDESLLPEDGVCIQQGCTLAKRLGFAGCSNQSEATQVERDIQLAEQTGCRLHLCHVSAAQSFELIRQAKSRRIAVSCEVTPHNLVVSCEEIQDEGRYKMNPPLRTPADREAALKAVLDGTVDAVATDHAPHTPQQKSGGFAKALNGVVGLETAFAALYTHLVLPGKLSVEKLIGLLTQGPSKVLREPCGVLEAGKPANLVVLDLQTKQVVDATRFLTKGRSSVFEGDVLQGWPVLTLYNGKRVFGDFEN